MNFNNGIPTGIEGFDATFGGIKGNGLTVFSHDDDFDMNSIAKYIACNAAYVFKKNVFFLSARDTMQTMIQAMEEYDTEEDFDAFSPGTPLQFDTLPMDFDAFTRKVRLSLSNHALDMVVINDIHLMESDPRKSPNKLLEKLHYYSITNNIPMLVTAPIASLPEIDKAMYVEVYNTFMLASDKEGRAAEIHYELKKHTPKDKKILKNFSYVDCNGLFDLRLPKYIKEIEPYAFVNCPHLSHVECVQELTKVDKNTFLNCPMVTEGIVRVQE